LKEIRLAFPIEPPDALAAVTSKVNAIKIGLIRQHCQRAGDIDLKIIANATANYAIAELDNLLACSSP
jgi:cell division protein ZapA (FtsZ GTPase activity inhibitor)